MALWGEPSPESPKFLTPKLAEPMAGGGHPRDHKGWLWVKGKGKELVAHLSRNAGHRTHIGGRALRILIPEWGAGNILSTKLGEGGKGIWRGD